MDTEPGMLLIVRPNTMLTNLPMPPPISLLGQDAGFSAMGPEDPAVPALATAGLERNTSSIM